MSIKIPTCYAPCQYEAPHQQEAPCNGVDKKHPQAQLSMAHKQTSCNTQNLNKLKNFADCVKTTHDQNVDQFS